MALTVVEDPTELALANNIVPVVLNNNFNDIATGGSKAALRLIFSSTGPVDGDTFTVTILGDSYVFTAKDTPDDSGLQFSTNAIPALSLADYIEQYIVDGWFNGHTIFSDNYNVTYGATNARLVARENGSKYDFSAITESLTNVVVDAGNPVAGVDDILRENYKVNLQVYDGDMRVANPTLLATLQGERDGLADINFQIQNILKSILDYDIPPFTVDFATCVKCVKQFSFAYFESYGSPSADKLRTIYLQSSSKNMKVLNGGLPSLVFALANRNNFLTRYVTGDNAFLTNCVQPKRTNTTAVEFLHYVVPADGTYNALATAQYSDGTTAYRYYINLPTLLQGDIVNIPTDLVSTDLDSLNPTKTIIGYYITVVDNSAAPGVAKSENYYYSIDPKHYESSNYFLFANKFGVMEIAWLRGRLGTGKTFTAAEAKLFTESDYTESDGQLVQYDNNYRGIYNIATGWLTSDEAEWLHELIDSPLVLKYQGMRGDAPILHRVLIEKAAMEDMYDDQQGLYGWVIKFKNSFLN